MDSFERFKNKIVIYAIVIMLIIAAGSVPVMKGDWRYFAGLLFGTVISVINLYLLAYECKQVATVGNKFISVWGYILRLFLFGAVFAICIKISLQSGLGAAIGIMTTKVAMMIVGLRKDKTVVQPEQKEENR